MKNRITTGIFFFLFVLTAAGVFAAFSQNPRQGLPAISITSQPGSTDETAEPHQGCELHLRIFTADSLFGFNGGMNLYRYADNNPILFVDPYGRLAVSITPGAWQSELLRWTKPYFFTLEGYVPSPSASEACPEYVVIQWTKGFVSYANAPDGWQSKFQRVQMYGVITDHNFPTFQVDSSGDTDPIFNSQGTLAQFPGGNNPWLDNLRFQKTFDESAYPLTGELEFVTAVYPFNDIKDSLNLTTLNGQAANFMYNQPPVAANRIWSLKFAVDSSDSMPQEDFSGNWP